MLIITTRDHKLQNDTKFINQHSRKRIENVVTDRHTDRHTHRHTHTHTPGSQNLRHKNGDGFRRALKFEPSLEIRTFTEL
jgi:hypothetical protein